MWNIMATDKKEVFELYFNNLLKGGHRKEVPLCHFMKGKAVILEDDIATIDLLAESLESLGFEAIIVSNGAEGLEAIYNHKPQLIFLNPAIEDVSDYQIYRFLKNKAEYRDVPVITLTDKPKDKLKLWKVKTSADYYLVKPLKREEIDIQLRHLIERFSGNINFFISVEKIKQFDVVIKNLADVCSKEADLHSSGIRAIFQQLIEIVAVMLRSEFGSILLRDKNENALVIKAAVGLSEEIIANTKVKYGEGICGWVAHQERPLLIRDIEKDEIFYKENNNKYNSKSFISVPVKFADVTGVINITNKITGEPYNITDLSLLLALVSQISLSFENSGLRLKAEEGGKTLNREQNINKILKEAGKFLDKELYEATISNEVNKIITANLDYSQTINAVIEIVEELVDFHICGLLLVDEENRGEIIINVKYPTTENDIEKFKLKIIESFIGLTNKVITKDKIVFDYSGSEKFPAVSADGEGARDVLNSFQARLLHNANKVIGLLAVSHSKKEAFDKEDLKLFSIVTQRSIPAINNAALHRKIKELSDRDDLTGLYRYRYLQEQLDKELIRADRYKSSFGVIMLDVDGFKEINDVYGHLQGDIVLKELSSILCKICRTVDIITRYGGEEFVVILPQTSKEGAFYLAERVRRVVKNYDFSSSMDKPIKLTVSLGVVNYPDSAASKLELLKKVDTALYQAKKDGKNITCQL